MTLTKAQIKHMVDRFLGWKLPSNFNPDNGISFERIAGANGSHPFTREPSGTNLFDATQADAMVRYMAEGLPDHKGPDAWECIDERPELRWIMGMVTVQRSTMEAWRKGNIKFVQLVRPEARGEA